VLVTGIIVDWVVLVNIVVDFFVLVVKAKEDDDSLDDVDEGKGEDVFVVLDTVRDKLGIFLLLVEVTVVSRVEEDGKSLEEADDDEVEEEVFIELDFFCDELVDFWLAEDNDEYLAAVLKDDNSADFDEVDVNLVAVNL
jgi:hypothetical protein